MSPVCIHDPIIVSLLKPTELGNFHEQFLELLRSAISPGPLACPGPAAISPRMWERMYVTAVRQEVAAVMYDTVQGLPEGALPPRDVLLKWLAASNAVTANYCKQYRVLADISGKLSADGIDILLLKGFGIASLYPDPQTRKSSDLDLWLYGRGDRLVSVLRGEHLKVVESETYKHDVLVYRGVMVENHNTLLEPDRHPMDRVLEPELHAILAGTHPAGSAPYVDHYYVPDEEKMAFPNVLIPSAEFNFIFLIRHTAQHFVHALTLKHLCDWKLFLDKYHATLDWDMVLRVIDKAGLTRFMKLFTGLCSVTLGIDSGNLPFQPDTDKRAMARMAEDIWTAGEKVSKMKNSRFLSHARFNLYLASQWKYRMVYGRGIIPRILQTVHGKIR